MTANAAVDTTGNDAPASFDVERIRADFPILHTQARGAPLVYLDSAATSQKPQCVIDALTDYYTTSNANVHRSVHYLAERATTAYEEARARVGRFVNAHSPESVIWVRGTTEAINLIAHSWGRHNLKAGDTVLLTEMEHHANLVPWHMLAKPPEKGGIGIQLDFVPITDDGRLDLEVAKAKLTGEHGVRPRLFGFMAKSNVLGTENPVAELCKLAHANGVVTLVDGAQSVPHGAVDFQALGCDFLAFSAHKALGPMGVGALIVNPCRYPEMGPYQGGGEMIMRVKLASSTYKPPPIGFEAGTPSAGDAIAFHAALDYLESCDLDAVHAHETRLTRLALDLLHERGIRTFGPDDAELRAGIVSFEVPGVHPHDVSTLLDGRGIAVRAGHHCCQPLMRKMGVVATSRASFYLYNTEDEVRQFAEGLDHVREYFKR